MLHEKFMHDLHAADKIHKLVLEYAIQNKLNKVSEIIIELGQVMEHGDAINPENLQFNLDMLNKGSVAEGAKIKIKRVFGDSWKLVSISGD